MYLTIYVWTMIRKWKNLKSLYFNIVNPFYLRYFTFSKSKKIFFRQRQNIVKKDLLNKCINFLKSQSISQATPYINISWKQKTNPYMIRTPTWSPNNSLKFPPEMQSFKPSFSCFDFDPNMERTNHFPELNPTLNSQSFMDFHIDNYFMQNPPQFPGNEFAGYLGENFPGIFHHEAKNVLPVSEPIALEGNEFHESNKREAIYFTESSSGNSCPPVSEDEIRRKNVITLFLVCTFWFFLFLVMQGVQGGLRASRTNSCRPSYNIFTRLRVGCG